jgi:hypothetical protein
LWDVGTGRELHTLKGHEGEISCVAFSPDGKLVASAGWNYSQNPDPAIRIWDAATGKELRRLHGQTHGVHALAFTPDGRALASAGASFDPQGDPAFAEALLLLDVATGQVLRRLDGAPARNHGDWRQVRALAFSPDGKTLASGESDQALVLYETLTGRVRRELAGHAGSIFAIAFSPDGRVVASAGSDLTALVWDARRLGPGEPRRGVLSPRELESCWTDLAGEDAARAYRALQAMAAVGPQSVPFLKGRLRPSAVAVDRQRLARLIADLDSDRFAVREEATAGLENLGELAEPALARALEGGPAPEARRRIEWLRERIAEQRGRTPAAEPLRALRGVELLEQIGTPEARTVLGALARGTSEARLTREAKGALERLDRRPAPAP